MILVDTNTIAYLYLPSNFSSFVEDVLKKDSHWIAPTLWRSELRNVLAVYIKKKLISLSDALTIQTQSEKLLHGGEYDVDSLSVLKLAHESGCPAYDCEFVYLAQYHNIKLITADKKLLRCFPEIAIQARNFSSSKT